ncbi:ABC transporter ATP-binding protein [Lysinibacillus sp. fkY74-1]|uniref:ABC transporter (ATP-binding protein) n=3 Tax=Lysinibacillus TaxID=400634 RepID=B1HWR9_LYSSC|nr:MULTISPECIES: ABC transporter ATP-binding protein [Lysinibacillus]MBE5082347.1 ABC transporter ATP-binding protein [Bacillus thuringiensis]ACA39904.1 ABC transporter (ATP-binding protein) [Lysinibacillus sphaericus C3-41]AMO33990.1 bacitracin ABC transporter ATP-binding protein [Lysinibacillus sphaericus]AMR90901.1 bacitracin ABC transporter ATP-binding protein [Lysinibacillus sphaericus]ANA44951.1 bacitracin ABC transporter ATP-binding protein [Lysinibacillus sphaericus]
MTEPIVQLQNLSKTIRGKQLIQQLNIDLYPGQITGFLGPNGAGKTTTIRMMTGLMHPTEGKVIIDGLSLQEHYEEAISKVGVIVENPEMYKFMSGYKNLLHFARMHKNVSKERIMEVVKQVGLENRIHEKVATYSLGMRQRLGLAQALLHRPKFLILDEPTNGLDPAGIREFRMYLRKIAAEDNVSVFVSSHLLSEIELMCDRVAVIQNGKLIDIREIHNESTSFYYVEAQPQEQVSAHLAQHDYKFEVMKQGYVIELKKEDVPALTLGLVQAGMQLFAVQPHQKTLEDQFLEMTGGGQIAEANSK